MDRNDAMKVIVVVVHAVALRKESVDRNINCNSNFTQKKVALRKESVDRNKIGIAAIDSIVGRSPQGERG